MTSTHIALLLLIAFSCWRDKAALREGGAISRLVFYALMAASFLLSIYISWATDIVYPSVWLSKVLEPLVRFAKP